ncbi:unannotated protein [freshwater metagenome]|uniref:Unannotated protein n=1 Tax=freshwater metagenome TaxID=449393 RepID=A0A6J6VY51_9ZZZZ
MHLQVGIAIHDFIALASLQSVRSATTDEDVTSVEGSVSTKQSIQARDLRNIGCIQGVTHSAHHRQRGTDISGQSVIQVTTGQCLGVEIRIL